MGTRWSMANSSLMACAALTTVLTFLPGPVAAREDQCVRTDGTVRRVEVAVEDPNRGVPCEVVYWKDSEEPGVRRVLWNARTDAAFCTRKADELVAKLTAVGWACTPVEESAAVREAAPATPSGVDRGAPAVASTAPATRTEPAARVEPAPRAEPAARAEPAPQSPARRVAG